jgi:hypothetical protein
MYTRKKRHFGSLDGTISCIHQENEARRQLLPRQILDKLSIV